MSFIRFLIIFIGFFYSSICSQVQSQIPSRKIYDLDSLCQDQMRSGNFPGMAVMISLNGKIIYSKGYGHADLDKKTNVDPHQSLFRIGSISKSLTAAALAMLVENKELDLDKKIQTYVPYFPEKKYSLTTRNLACHTAGIRHYQGLEFMLNQEFNDVKSGIDLFKNDTLLFKPGSKYRYSTYGWNLISAGIEGAIGQDFISYMDQNVFKPLGMSNTHAERESFKDDHIVAFYNQNSEGVPLYAMPVNNSYKWAGGGFLSTADDIIKFGNGINSNVLFSEETKDMFWTSCRLNDGSLTNYGLGWVANTDDQGRSFVGHSGGSVGGTSMLLIYPEEELVVVVLVNLSQARMNSLPWKLADVLLD